MTVTDILELSGPMTTSHAARFLQETGLSPEAARKAVSRRSKGISTLHGLPFPKRARFIYLDVQFGTDNYWSKLTEAIHEANPAYAAALSGLRARGGVVLRKHFDIISGSPTIQKRQLASSVVLERLKSVKLMTSVMIDGLGECVVLGQSNSINSIQLKVLRARLLTESVLLDAIRSWATRMNMTSQKVTRIRDESPMPKVGTFNFDISGPSYLRPLLSFANGEPQPGFFVADVILGQDLDEQMVSPFIRKCVMLGNLGKVKPVIPMLIADNFTPDALWLCRSKGIIATRPATLFGNDVARALEDLLKTLTNASSAVNETPSQLESLFRRLGAIEGAAGNLRGALFELIVGHSVRSIEGGTVDIGMLVNDRKSGKRAELDVRLVKEKQVSIYECKGYQPSAKVAASEIKEWLEERIPVIYSALKAEERFSATNFIFEFWTCGTFDNEALALLEGAQANIYRYRVAWKNGKDIQNYASGLAAPGIRKILNEHYFNHPINVFQAIQ
jgi:hypothetical protein